MTRPRAALVLVVTCTALGVVAGGLVGIATAPLAHAQTSGDGYFGEGTIGAGIVDTTQGVIDTATNLATGVAGTIGRSSGGSGGGEPSPFQTVRHYYGDHSDPTYGVNSPFPCPTNPDGSQQLPYQDVTTDTRTGAITSRATGCEAPSQASTPVAGQPAQPPMPPTAAELWNATPVPQPKPGIKGTMGLTGAETWAWDTSAVGPVSVTVTIRGYTATSTAGPQSWRWDMAASGPSSVTNPPSVSTTASPGSANDPAVRYRYSTKGLYQIEVIATWSGTFSFSGNGQPAQTRSLGTTTRTSTTPYHVVESRPVLVAS